MVTRWAVMVATAVGASGASAQRVAITELQAGGSGVIATHDFWGGEVGIARRPGGQLRQVFTVALGDAAGSLGVRVRAAAQFVLKPGASRGTSPYAGVGLAFAAARGARGAGYLAVMAGWEAAPARVRGWYVELGFEGGARVAAGVRWRRFGARRT